MEAKFSGRNSLEQAFDGPRQMGEQLGLVFNMEKITKAPNTMLSHCLIALAPESIQENVIEDVYAAYFEHGEDIGDIETLIQIGQRNGLEERYLREGLTNPALHKQIEAEVQHAYRLGISGVPFFVINNKYGFSGAQPPGVILGVLQQVVDEGR
jgi:predicted DsbA family dithiol-disulfide isomerase